MEADNLHPRNPKYLIGTEEYYWQHIRVEAAMRAMQSICSVTEKVTDVHPYTHCIVGKKWELCFSPEVAADLSITYADALVKELKKGE